MQETYILGYFLAIVILCIKLLFSDITGRTEKLGITKAHIIFSFAVIPLFSWIAVIFLIII